MNGVSDCTQTVMANSNFATDIAQWNIQATATAQWVPTGAHGAATGGIHVDNINHDPARPDSISIAGAEQCVLASPGNYQAYAQAFVDSGQPEGSVGIYLFYFRSTNCTGPLITALELGKTSTKGVWNLLHGIATVPAETASMKVRLVIFKKLGLPSFKATFDNILIAPNP